MNKRFYLLLLLLLFVQDLFGQCAMCRAVADDSSQDGPTNLNNGILYIMAIPYVILFIAFRKKIWGFLKELREAKG